LLIRCLLSLSAGLLLSSCAFDPSGSYVGTLTEHGELFVMVNPPGPDGKGVHTVIGVAPVESELKTVVRKVKDDELSIELVGRCSFRVQTAPEPNTHRGEVILPPVQHCPLKVKGKSYEATVAGAVLFQRDETPVVMEASLVLSPGEYPATDKPGSVSGGISWKFTGRAVD
jgi:hypothetical protein